MNKNQILDAGVIHVAQYRKAFTAAITFAEAFIVEHAGSAWALQDMDGPILNILVFADIEEKRRKKILKAITQNGGTFLEEYCAHKETQLWIRGYRVACTDTFPAFYVKVLVPKEVNNDKT